MSTIRNGHALRNWCDSQGINPRIHLKDSNGTINEDWWNEDTSTPIPSQVVLNDLDAAFEATILPDIEWKQAMHENDQVLPRYAEDLYDALNPVDQANVSQSTKNKVAAKKALRATGSILNT
jgi:hypothetical protein